ncbi:MAG: aldolase [Salinivirgaceae bacterium]|nr:MAG: aldolase [Salinivirgaceae bacterium]
MEKQYKKEVAQIMNRLYQKGLTTTSGGNVSMRVENNIYITPSQTDKGNMNEDEIGVITIKGENLTPDKKLSMETGMHLAIYHQRTDVQAIVHAHPFTATTLAAEPGLIDTTINGEARAMLGNPAFAAYQTMGTSELASEVAKSLTKSNIAILQHHGILAVGENLLQAFDRLELMEMTARGNVLRKIMGIESKISDQNIAILDNMFKIL